jgi:hypothetical protein
MSIEFHIFASIRNAGFELEIPGEDGRIEFCSLFEAARHARMHPSGRNATVVIHDQNSKLVNRIPLYANL